MFGGGLVRQTLILLGFSALLGLISYFFRSWLWVLEFWTGLVTLLVVLDCAGATRRTLWLLAAGLVWLAPAFYHPKRVWCFYSRPSTWRRFRPRGD
jgi:hypothetical protein